MTDPTTTAFPWDILGNVGAAGIAVVMCVIFLRELAAQRKEFTASLKEISSSLGDRIDRVHARLDEFHENWHNGRR